MSVVARFRPANARARQVTVGDMEHALVELARALPEWAVETEPAGAWQVTLRRTQKIRGKPAVTHEMAMWSRDADDGVDIGGFDEEVIDFLGQWLADRAGAQLFEDDAGSDPVEWKPRRGAKLTPPPKPTPRARRKRARAGLARPAVARFVPLDVLVDDLDPLARAAWVDLDADVTSRAVTVGDAQAALEAEVRSRRGWKLVTTGSGASWRATLAPGRGPAIELGVDRATQHLTITADLEHPVIAALGFRFVEAAGPQGLVVGDAAVTIFVGKR